MFDSSRNNFFLENLKRADLLLFLVFKWFGKEVSRKKGWSVYERKFQFFQDTVHDLFCSSTLTEFVSQRKIENMKVLIL